MQAYKDGSRQHDEMRVFAELFEPADLEEIARYYASLKPRRAERVAGSTGVPSSPPHAATSVSTSAAAATPAG